MPFVEDRGGLDLGGKNPSWKGYPVAIVERVLRILDKYKPSPDVREIGSNTRFYPFAPVSTGSFLDLLDMDSLDDVELMIAIEEEFAIAIPDAHAQSISTVGQLILYVKDRTG